MKEIFTFLVGGKAGDGVKKAGGVGSRLLADMGRYVFNMNDYMSLIRGGHNFSVVSSALRPIQSPYLHCDVVVCLDKRSYNLHKDKVVKGGLLFYNSDDTESKVGIGVPFTSMAKEYGDSHLKTGAGAVACLAASLGMTPAYLKKLVTAEYSRGIEHNCDYTKKIYDLMLPLVKGKFKQRKGKKKLPLISGNQAICLGAAAGGLDVYVAYPMTPSSSLLHFYAKVGSSIGVATCHPENEIGVINMAVGAATVGAKAMCGSSGGGVALMQETFSLCGIAEIPLLCVLSSRPGPATGVPTYTSQGDLNFAINQGHGEFSRIVASPASQEEAYFLSAEMLNLCWKYQIPGMLVTEKHLSESYKTVDLDVTKAKWAEGDLAQGKDAKNYSRYKITKNGISPMLFPPKKGQVMKWTSYEHFEDGITTEEPVHVNAQVEKRLRKHESLLKGLKKCKTVKVHGKKPGKKDTIIVTYGSTTMSVLEALKFGKIKATVVQPIYVEPFPVWEMEKYKDCKIIVVELTATGMFANLLKKNGMKVKKVIKQYDGRPFEPVDLAKELRRAL